jgi:hypothetical protein
LPADWESKLTAAPFLFDVKDWFEFFERYGWQPSHTITSLEESQRLNRPYPLDFPYGLLLRVLPRAMSRQIQSMSGAVLMRRLARPRGREHTERKNTATTWSVMDGHA